MIAIVRRIPPLREGEQYLDTTIGIALLRGRGMDGAETAHGIWLVHSRNTLWGPEDRMCVLLGPYAHTAESLSMVYTWYETLMSCNLAEPRITMEPPIEKAASSGVNPSPAAAPGSPTNLPRPRCLLRCHFGFWSPYGCEGRCKRSQRHGGACDCLQHQSTPKKPPPPPPPVPIAKTVPSEPN